MRLPYDEQLQTDIRFREIPSPPKPEPQPEPRYKRQSEYNDGKRYNDDSSDVAVSLMLMGSAMNMSMHNHSFSDFSSIDCSSIDCSSIDCSLF